MGPQQGKGTSPRCGLMKRRRVLGRGPLHRLPRKRSVTSALHLVLLESDLYWGTQRRAMPPGSVGQGQGLPPPAALGALVLRTQWRRHQLRSPQWTGEEKDTLSHQGWGGAENEKHVSSSMGETSCARGEGRAPPFRVWAPASPPHLEKASESPAPTCPNQIVDFKFLPSCSSRVTPRRGPAPGAQSLDLCWPPGPGSTQEVEGEGGKITQ